MIAAQLKPPLTMASIASRWNFRDQLIAAQLKPRAPPGASSSWSNFRDQLIAAQLKRRPRAILRPRLRNFRDQLIAAQLKRPIPRQLIDANFEFPLSADRGPIEARKAKTAHRPAGRISAIS